MTGLVVIDEDMASIFKAPKAVAFDFDGVFTDNSRSIRLVSNSYVVGVATG